MGNGFDQEDPLGILEKKKSSKKQEDPLGILKKKETSGGSSETFDTGESGGLFTSIIKMGSGLTKGTDASTDNIPDNGPISDINVYNRMFETNTGINESGVVPQTDLFLRSEQPGGQKILQANYKKGREVSQEDIERKKYQQYKFIEAKEIAPVISSSVRGVVSGKQLSDLYEKPYGKKVVDAIITNNIPEYKPLPQEDNAYTPEKNWDEIAKAIQIKNRAQGVQIQNTEIDNFDKQLATELKDVTITSIPTSFSGGTGGAGFDPSSVKTYTLAGIDTNSPAALSSAISAIEQGTNVTKAGAKVDKQELIDKLNTKLFYLISEKPIHPEITALSDKIKEGVTRINIDRERGENIPIEQFAKNDEENRKHFELGLNFVKEVRPGTYLNIKRALEKRGVISDTDFEELAKIGQSMYNQQVFKGAAADPSLIGKESYIDYTGTTWQTKKSEYARVISEEIKSMGFKNRLKIPQPIIDLAVSRHPELTNKNIIEDIKDNEANGGYGIAKGGGVFSFFRGIATPIKGIQATINAIIDSPVDTYLNSKKLDLGDQKIADEKGQFSEELPSERGNIWNDMLEGAGQFIPQVLLAKGVGNIIKAPINAGLGAAQRAALTAGQSAAITNYAGTFLSTYMQTYGSSYADMLQKTGDVDKARLGGAINGIASAAFELILPDTVIASRISNLFKKGGANLATDIIKLVEKGADKATIKTAISGFLKNTVNTVGQEIAEEDLTNIVDFATESILSPSTVKDRDLAKELWETTKQTALAMLIPSILGGGGQTNKPFNKQGLHDAAINLPDYKEALETGLTNETINQDDYNRSLHILNTHRKSLATTPPLDQNDKEISRENKLEYAFQETQIKLNEEKADKESGVARELTEKKIKQAQDVQRSILMPEGEKAEEATTVTELTPEQQIIRTALDTPEEIKDPLFRGMAEAAVANPEVATQFIADIKSQAEGEVAGELGKAEEGQRNSFGNTIVDFALGKKQEEAAAPTPQVAEVQNIESKKADIEKRRTEALDNIIKMSVGNDIEYRTFKDNGNGKNALRETWSLSGSNKEELSKQINDKYDAELAALEKSSPAQVAEVSENVLKDVESTTKAIVKANPSNSAYEKITDLIADEKFDRESSEEVVAEEYHKAKADGSNPKLVKAVEDLLIPEASTKEPAPAASPGPAIIMPGEIKPAPIVPLVGSTQVAPEKKKLSDRLRSVSSKIATDGLSSILPDWAKADLPEGTEEAGFGGTGLDKAIAKAINLVADALDAGAELAAAIEKGFADLKEYYRANTKSFNEKRVRADFERNVTAILERADTPDQQPAGEPSKGNNFNFFKNRELSLTGEKAEFLSKPTIEEAGKEITQPFEYTKAELDLMVEDGKRWISEARQQFNDNAVHYAQRLFKDLRAIRGRMAVKAVGMVNLLNSIDLDLKYKELSNGERDILRNIRIGLELEIAKNAREGSLTLNAQRLIHKLYKGEYKFTEAMEQIVTEPVQKTADDVATKMKAGKSDISDAARKQHRKQTDKKQDTPKKEKKPKEKKTTFFEKAVKGMSKEEVDKLKQQITDISNKLKCR